MNEEFKCDKENLDNPCPIQGPESEIGAELVNEAMKNMKSRKVTEMLKTSGDIGIGMLTSLTNSIIREGKIPVEKCNCEPLQRQGWCGG